MHQILFVCMGNLCRSPMAEAVFSLALAQRGMDHLIAVSSAGTSAHHQGEPADPRAMKVATARGYDRIRANRARFITESMVANADIVLTMDSHNLRELKRRFRPQYHGKMHMLLPYAGVTTAAEVPDPYFGSEQGFINVLTLLEASTEGVLKRVNSLPTSVQDPK